MTKLQKLIATFLSVGIFGALVYGGTPGRSLAETSPVAATSTRHPVVLELFQSQGCSSCPPALAVLDQVADRPDVLALNFAVTYWDQLGWKDNFARAGGRGNVQTPQLIVDGRAAILGSRKGEVEAAIAKRRTVAGAPDIVGNGDTVTVGQGAASTSAQVWLVDYDPRTVAVPIRAGENGGRTLNHRNIVRRITVLGTWQGKSAVFQLPRRLPGMARAILVQAGIGGPITAGRKI